MCGITGIFGQDCNLTQLELMIASQRHRGPDATNLFINSRRTAGLGHNRLSIIDLSRTGTQPMSSYDDRFQISFNGAIYNYLELRSQLSDYPFQTNTDTEVLLAAYQKWGKDCLNRLIGMFAFAIWDEVEQRLIAARDRFGVKPFYYHVNSNATLFISSEIKALHKAGISAQPDCETWATYLGTGLYEHTEKTFWHNIYSLPPGSLLDWHDGRLKVSRWYDLVEQIGIEFDSRPVEIVTEEYFSLLKESINLRFRADVSVGINISGGIDSSALTGLARLMQKENNRFEFFTFVTGDPRYDELPWVQEMLDQDEHLSVDKLTIEQVPSLAHSVQYFQDEPFGGLPTLAYAKLFERARQRGVAVILDGQGMDEQLAGYDYYLSNPVKTEEIISLQGTAGRAIHPEILIDEFRNLAKPFIMSRPFPETLRNLQLKDILYTKIPRALRFNDRVSMRSSIELREPFLDHRLFELALRQPADRKIVNDTGKWLLRQIVKNLLPVNVVEAPKRPLQTPQREWLRGGLSEWANECIEQALRDWGGIWLDAKLTRIAWRKYLAGNESNSFYIWQWINLGLMSKRIRQF